MFKNARLVKSGFPALTLQEEQVIGFFGISFSENQGYCEAGSMMLLQKKYILNTSSTSLIANQILSVAFNSRSATSVQPAPGFGADASTRCVISEGRAERAGRTQALHKNRTRFNVVVIIQAASSCC